MMSYQHWNLPSGEASPDLYLKMSEVAWDLTGLLNNEADQVHEGSPFFWIKIISCLEDFYYFKTKRIQIQVLCELLRMTNTKDCKLRARKEFYIINFIWMNKSYTFL